MIIEHGGESYIRLSDLYNAVEYPLMFAPFFGSSEPVVMRRLTYAQIRACGDFSLIETTKDIIEAKSRKLTSKEIADYSELQYNIIKKSLVNPTYDEIMSLGKYDLLRVEAEKELVELENIINEMPEGIEKRELLDKYYIVKSNSQYILPDDFVSFVMRYALQQDDSDIKDITEDMLFESAIRAKNGTGNPSDHLPGNFTDFNKVDINNRAWIIYHKRTATNGKPN